MVRPDYCLDHWRAVREDAALAVEQMPAAQLDYRPQDDLMSFREVAAHILDTGCGLAGLLLDGETDFTAPDFRRNLERYRRPLPETPAGIAAELRAAVAADCAALSGQTPEFFAGMVTKWDGARLTRLEMLQFVIEHEVAHRMQLFVYLRMNGVVPPTTKRRSGGKS